MELHYLDLVGVCLELVIIVSSGKSTYLILQSLISFYCLKGGHGARVVFWGALSR